MSGDDDEEGDNKGAREIELQWLSGGFRAVGGKSQCNAEAKRLIFGLFDHMFSTSLHAGLANRVNRICQMIVM